MMYSRVNGDLDGSHVLVPLFVVSCIDCQQAKHQNTKLKEQKYPSSRPLPRLMICSLLYFGKIYALRSEFISKTYFGMIFSNRTWSKPLTEAL